MQAQRSRPTTNATMQSPVADILYLEAILKRKFNQLMKSKKYYPLKSKVTFLDILDKLFKHHKTHREILELEDFLDEELLAAGFNPSIPIEAKKTRKPPRLDLLPGTTPTKNGKRWCARINVGGKIRHLGVFDSEEEAHQAYKSALNKSTT